MEINTTTMTALEPAFGMPAYQSTPRAAACVRATGASWTARGRHAGIAMPIAVPAFAATAVVTDALVKGAFPGPDAWSPPRD